MAKQPKNTTMAGARGKVGNVVFRQVRGKTVLQARPTKSEKRSKAQTEQAKKMQRANRYATAVIQHPEIEKQYRSGIRPNLPNAYRVAVADYLNAPVVHEIRTEGYTGEAGEVIKIKATDDFKVVSVEVVIKNARGQLIEKGQAARYINRPAFWKYHTTSKNEHRKDSRILATASDMPGNMSFLEAVLS